MKQSNQLIHWLIQQDTVTVREWLQKAWSNPQAVPEHLNWKHLVAALEVLAKSGQGANHGTPDLEWADITVSIYEYLIQQADPFSQIALRDHMMELKAYCILHKGNFPGDTLLDVSQIITWFFQYLPFSIEEVENMLQSSKNMYIDDLAKLRYIKKKLYFIHLLVDTKKLLPHEELIRWLSVREKLP